MSTKTFLSVIALLVILGRGDVAHAQLSPVRGAAWTGQFSLSVDGNGTPASAGTVRVEKPPDATVQDAYLVAAAEWTSSLPDRSISLAGVPIKWDKTFLGAGATENGWADVTAIVAPIVDAAPAGILDIAVEETNSRRIDGEILVVVFKDPGSLHENTIILLFGGQDVEGETFRINLAEPIDLSDEETRVHMGLGISFSAQYLKPGYEEQFSVIEVNGKRLTTSAGGRDDGVAEDGGLLTVGGIGDSFRNPEEPFQAALNDFSDDELYDLLPFIEDGDDLISVFTKNPSDDDNIFFAWFETSVPAAMGESVILTPPAGEGAMGVDHTLVATLNTDRGKAIPSRKVTFEVIAGPNKGKKAILRSNKKGIAAWRYSGMAVGVDSIQARFFSPLTDETMYSNIVLRTWRSFAVSPGSLNFDSVAVSFPANQPLTLANKDELASLELRVVTPDGFVASPDSLLLTAGEMTSLNVTFTPESEIRYHGNLHILERDTGKRLAEVPLKGVGYVKAPQIAVSDSVLDFGAVTVNTAREAALTVSNTLEHSILEVKIRLADSTFSVSPDSFTIRGANHQEILIGFNPFAEGPYTADLVVASNSKNQAEARVRLAGMGTSPGILSYWPAAVVFVVPASLVFMLAYKRKKKNGPAGKRVQEKEAGEIRTSKL